MPKHRDQATPVDGDAPPVPWHALDARTLSTRLDTPVDGLNEAEVCKRLEQWGPNQLPHARSTPAWRRFARQFNNLLIYVLLISAGWLRWPARRDLPE